MNIDNKLLYFVSAFDPLERKKTHTVQKMIKFAGKTKRFNDSEMLTLEVQIKKYVDLSNEVIPKFNAGDRLDAFFDDIWSKMTDPNEPSQFKRLCKIVLSLSHGQASIERGFRLVTFILAISDGLSKIYT